MVEAERAAQSDGRGAGIVAARDRFYKGDIAHEMVAFLKEHGTPFERDDFAEYYARIEEPASVTYRGYTVYKQSFNSQGPTLLQTLNILETFDLRAMGHGSADYVHVLVEAMKLAYADRDSYYADPEFVKVPAKGLLSKDYAKVRAKLIDMAHASEVLRGGDPVAFDPDVDEWPFWVAGESVESDAAIDNAALEAASLKDTTHIAIIDRHGNIFDSTPSGGWTGGAVILGDTGIGMSVRGEQFWLDDTRAAQAPPTVASPLYAHPEHRHEGRRALPCHRNPRRRQPGADDHPDLSEHRRVLGRLVSEPAHGDRTTPCSDVPFARLVLAARARPQPPSDRGRRGGRGDRSAEKERT